MLTNVFLKTLWDQRKALFGWTVALTVYAFLIVIPFPSTKDIDFSSIEGNLRFFMGGARTLSTLEGYLTSQIFYLPLALGVFMSLLTAKLINVEIASGAMDILLSHPISRVSVVVQKYAGAGMVLVILGLVFALALWLAGLTISEDLPFSDSVLVGLNLIPISLFYFSVAFTIACFSRGPRLPIGIGCGVTALTWILHGLSQSTEMFANIERWTVFYWYITGKPFSDGLIPLHMGLLLVLSVVLAVVGTLQFRQRDF